LTNQLIGIAELSMNRMRTTKSVIQKTPKYCNLTLTQKHNMAFVNETLTEQDKVWFASFKFQSVS